LAIDDRWEQKAFLALAEAHPKRKPNLIFDVTGKSLKHFSEVADIAKTYGYDMKDIHVVWVIDSVTAAMKKNLSRDRVVPEDIFLETHEGAALTAKKLASMGKDIKKYMNGDYWFVFNQMKVDSTLVKSESGGSYIKDANYFRIKARGKAPISPAQIGESILRKIKEYTPNTDVW